MLIVIYMLAIVVLLLLTVILGIKIYNELPFQNKNRAITTVTSLEIKKDTNVDDDLSTLCHSLKILFDGKDDNICKLCCTNINIVKKCKNGVITTDMISSFLLSNYKIETRRIKFEYHNCYSPQEKNLCIEIIF